MKTYVVNISIYEITSKNDGKFQTKKAILQEQIAGANYQAMRNELAVKLGETDGKVILGKAAE